MKVNMPAQLVGRTSTIVEAFIARGANRGDSRIYATELVRMLPQELKEAAVWQDRLTNLWRYEYGLPYEALPNDTVAVGTNGTSRSTSFTTLSSLGQTTISRGEQSLGFLSRMADRGKHEDVLFEMRPVLKIKGCPRHQVRSAGDTAAASPPAIGQLATLATVFWLR